MTVTAGALDLPSGWIERAATAAPKMQNLIDGAARLPAHHSGSDKFSPRDGKPLFPILESDGAEIDQAVVCARAALADGRWSQVSSDAKRAVLLRLAELILEHQESLAALECLDVGKPISQILDTEIPRAVSILRYCAEAVDKLPGQLFGHGQSSLAYRLSRPAGVVGIITAWNYPMLLAVTRVATALAAGNSIVLKPSEMTPLTTLRVAELALEAGLPPGVLNVVQGGASVGSAIAAHHDIDLLSFTGGTETGKRIMQYAGASNMKRLVLECGGKCPNIVFNEGFDLAAVADAVTEQGLRNQGQLCVASSRILVEQNILDEFTQELKRSAARFIPKDPFDPNTRFGPLISQQHLNKVANSIERTRTDGGELVYAGSVADSPVGGYYIAPHIFSGISSSDWLAQNEVFGPVLAVMGFSDEDEAVSIANSTIYGLSAIAWTSDTGRALRLAARIETGTLAINGSNSPTADYPLNAPTFGAMKQSGAGLEGGLRGIAEYMNETTVLLMS